MPALPPIFPAPSGASSPLDFLLDHLAPPEWVIAEVQNRLILLLNHVLMQESEAQSRLFRQKGRVVRAEWRSFAINFIVTPAGLLDRAASGAMPDLSLAVTERSPLALLNRALASQKPEVRIEGDVQLAAEVNWLVDHLRWDFEEDLSRVLGDAPAHALGNAARRAAAALRSFVASRPSGPSGMQPADTASTASAPPA